MTKATSSKTETNVIIDPSDPFYLHSSDHPGISLVTKPLNGDNYATWSRLMSIALSAKNKTGFVDGSIDKPPAADEKHALWQRCNDMVLSWILNSIDPNLGDSVLYTESATEVWADLKERFSQNNAPRIFQIERDIASLHQGTMSVAAYYSKLKGLWDELSSYNDMPICTCGAIKGSEEREQRGKVMQFLMGLNDTYSAIRGQILLIQPLPTIRKIYNLILQEEKQRDVAVSREILLAATQTSNNDSSSHNKGRGKLHCNHCNRDNHTVEKCFHLHGFPLSHKFHKKCEKSGNKSGPTVNNSQPETPSFTQE